LETSTEPTRPVLSDDWIVFRRVGGPRLPITRAVDVAAAMRGALLSWADDPPPEVLTGHRPDGSPLSRPHVAFAALPFVGHEHADGSLLGVAVILPREVDELERRALLRAIGAWEDTRRLEDEESPVLELKLGRAGVVELERVAWGLPPLANQRSTTWCRPSRFWISVTPVALDQNPGHLYSHDHDRADEAYHRAAETVARSCTHVGLPLPSTVTVIPSVTLAGTVKARDFPPYPPSDRRTRRVKVHAVLEFDELVAGPVLLGAGRYYGLGLFRPLREEVP